MKSFVCSCLICIFANSDPDKEFVFTSHFWAKSTVMSRDVVKEGTFGLLKVTSIMELKIQRVFGFL